MRLFLLLAIAAVALILISIAARNGYGFGGNCRSFWGESFNAGAWSSSGQFLSAYATGDDGQGHVRVYRWPGMDVVNEASAYMDALNRVPVDDDGTVYWTVIDPFDDSTSAVLWRKRIGAAAEAIPATASALYLDLYWAAGGLVAADYDPGPPERSRLTRVTTSAIAAQPLDSTPWTTIGTDLWIDRSGEWSTWTESDMSNTDTVPVPQDLVVRHGDEEWRLTLPGHGGRVPTLTPNLDAVMYQRSETAHLTLIDFRTGALLGEVDPGEYYGGELSAIGVLATATAVGPWQNSDMCVVDVSARLAQMVP